ncbi:glycosyltransferase family 4 protein [Streptococcaceae bacterium ESL0729]|nr:glycosyltransferase family 4 protein [Streptococcaceae bacterium ESL0729]
MTKKKKILFVSPTGMLDNGAELSIANLMFLLKDRGHEVINLAPKSPYEGYDESFNDKGIAVERLKVTKFWWADAPGGLPASEEIIAQAHERNIEEISQIIRQRAVDLVITNTANVFVGAVAAKRMGVAHFQLIHEFPDGEFSYYDDRLKFFSDHSSEIFAVQGKLAETLQERFDEEGLFQTINTFVPFVDYKEKKLSELEASQTSFIYISRLTERKNQLEILRALNLILPDFPDLKVKFIGGYDEAYRQKMVDFIKLFELEKNVEFIGNQPNPWAMVTDRDIAVFPSADETFGLAYGEAVLNGVPAIFTDNRGFKSAYPIFQAGLMYRLGDITGLARMMADMYENFPAFKADALERVNLAKENYNLESCYKNIIDKIEG